MGRTQRVDYPHQSRCVAILAHGDALQRQAVGIQRDLHQVPSELGERRDHVARAVHDENRREHSLIHRLDNLGEQLLLAAELVVHRLSRHIGSLCDGFQARAVAVAQENRLRRVQYQFAYPLGLPRGALLARAPTIVARDRNSGPAARSPDIESRCDFPIDRRHAFRRNIRATERTARRICRAGRSRGSHPPMFSLSECLCPMIL